MRTVKDGGRPSPTEIVLAPLALLFHLSPLHVAIAAAALAAAVGFAYYYTNSDFWGLADPRLAEVAISGSYEEFKADDGSWKIEYEKPGDTEFAGLVRQVVPIRLDVRILTHDVLVTSGDYADPDRVTAFTFDHKFFFRPRGSAEPTGKINLLHTVPASDGIYRQLLAIRAGDQVVIAGREIAALHIFDRDGTYRGYWNDRGCNTLLVKAVTILGR